MKAVQNDLRSLKALARKGDPFEQHLIARLQIAVDNGFGCLALADAGLAAPVVSVARSIFESLIATYWAALREENAKTIIEAGLKEQVRLLRKKVGRGSGDSLDEFAKTEMMQGILKLDAARPPRLSDMAEQADLMQLYDGLYGELSIFAHGTATELLAATPPTKVIIANVQTSVSFVEAIHLIVANHLREHRLTPREELVKSITIVLYL